MDTDVRRIRLGQARRARRGVLHRQPRGDCHWGLSSQLYFEGRER
jgi:hypothetical protein